MRGVRREKKFTELTDLLTKKHPKTDVAVFPSKKALQCYAACLGFEKKSRVALSPGAVDSIEWHTFDNGNFTDYIYVISLAHSKDLAVLGYDIEKSDKGEFNEDMVSIFEEYANGGFEIIQNWLNKNPNDSYGTGALIAGLKRDGFLSMELSNNEEKPFPKVKF